MANGNIPLIFLTYMGKCSIFVAEIIKWHFIDIPKFIKRYIKWINRFLNESF